MDDEFKRSMDDFSAVWLRVSGQSATAASPAPAADEDALFRAFIRDAYCSAVFCSALAKMFPAPGRAVLLSHAQECKNRCRVLRAEYFIRSGEVYTPDGGCPPVGGKLASLRAAMRRSLEQAAVFRRTADSPVSETLRELCGRFAAECERHAQEQRALLVDCF